MDQYVNRQCSRQCKKQKTPIVNGIPEWLIWVVKWFMNGLNGPFGTILKFHPLYLSTFFNDDSTMVQKVHHPIRCNLIPGHNSVAFTQDDSTNCEVCCLIFIIDL